MDYMDYEIGDIAFTVKNRTELLEIWEKSEPEVTKNLYIKTIVLDNGLKFILGERLETDVYIVGRDLNSSVEYTCRLVRNADVFFGIVTDKEIMPYKIGFVNKE